jgi:hypothetical protein
MLRELFRTILDCASGYAAKGGPMMERRDEALKAARTILESWLAEDVLGTPFETLRLNVQFGGRQADYGPVPWIRIYSPIHSPRTTEGVYLVFLFGAEGRRVYLSLNQGTSEWRGNKMRPISNPSVICAEAMASRLELDANPLFHSISKTGAVDLEIAEVKVGSEARKRVRNYELANIVAIPYESSFVPDDASLRNDIAKMLPLLAQLYGVDAPPTWGPRKLPPQDKRQGRIGKAARDAIERYAVALATEYYESRKWAVEDVGKYRSYDLHCTRDGEELHVECKGTTGLGEEVVLTRGEVNHCRNFSHCALVVVSEIEVDEADPSCPRTSGGVVRVLEPWNIEEERLTPMQFFYRVQ